MSDAVKGPRVSIGNFNDNGTSPAVIVEALSRIPGLGVAPHDHQMWGIVDGIDGIETNIKWYVLVQKG